MKRSSKQEKVDHFFNDYARDFQSIYIENEKSIVTRVLDRTLRRSMFKRFQAAYDYCREHKIKTLIDIGCGPAVHDIALAKGLGIQILGIDSASSMIDLAKESSRAEGLDALCQFQLADFMTWSTVDIFEVALCVGVVEYISEPEKFLSKMMGTISNACLFSLPVKWHWLTPQRVIRYALRDCPLKFYSYSEVVSLVEKAGVREYKILRLNRDFLVICSV